MLGNWSRGAVATICLCYRNKQRRLTLCSAELQKCLRAAWKETEAPFTPHIGICLVPRLCPDAFNPALKMCLHCPHWERTFLCDTLVNAMCNLRYSGAKTGFFFLFYPRRGFCFGTAHLFIAVKKFICCCSPLLSSSGPWETDRLI